MEKLISGGIYTISTQKNNYYVFVFVDFSKDNNLIFMATGVNHSNATNIKLQVDKTIKYTSEKGLAWKKLMYTKDQFEELCDGFLGTIDDESLQKLNCVDW